METRVHGAKRTRELVGNFEKIPGRQSQDSLEELEVSVSVGVA